MPADQQVLSIFGEETYVVIGPMGYSSELGAISEQEAIEKAKLQRDEFPPERRGHVKLCVRTKHEGAQQIDF